MARSKKRDRRKTSTSDCLPDKTCAGMCRELWVAFQALFFVFRYRACCKLFQLRRSLRHVVDRRRHQQYRQVVVNGEYLYNQLFSPLRYRIIDKSHCCRTLSIPRLISQFSSGLVVFLLTMHFLANLFTSPGFRLAMGICFLTGCGYWTSAKYRRKNATFLYRRYADDIMYIGSSSSTQSRYSYLEEVD